jgi:dTDP-4-dehydrorhamnose reductase
MRMKILVFGRNGQVGWELQRSLAPLGEVVAVDRASTDHCGDLNELDGIRDTIRAVRPDVIVNAAAYTAVDKAESEVELCRRINALAPEAMAQEAARLGGWLVHYSTDYVFDGAGTRPWREDDPVAPVNAYGAAKADGEARIAAAGGRHVVLRTSWVYADQGANFINTMLRLGQERDRLTIVNDQHGAPTGAALIADVTAHAVRTLPSRPEVAGVYHLVPGGETTWFGLADYVFGLARAWGVPIKAAIEGIPTSAYPTPAKRPHNSRLDNGKLQAAFGLQLPAWQQGVRHMLAGKIGRDRARAVSTMN